MPTDRKLVTTGLLRDYGSGPALPGMTPIVGHLVSYERWCGDSLTAEDAVFRFLRGEPVYYRTYMDPQFAEACAFSRLRLQGKV